MTQPETPTPSEARAIMRRFNASHFDLKDQEHARYRIPADHSHDDDLRMEAFIQSYEAATARAAELEGALRDVESKIVDYAAGRINFRPDDFLFRVREVMRKPALPSPTGTKEGA